MDWRIYIPLLNHVSSVISDRRVYREEKNGLFAEGRARLQGSARLGKVGQPVAGVNIHGRRLVLCPSGAVGGLGVMLHCLHFPCCCAATPPASATTARHYYPPTTPPLGGVGGIGVASGAVATVRHLATPVFLKCRRVMMWPIPSPRKQGEHGGICPPFELPEGLPSSPMS